MHMEIVYAIKCILHHYSNWILLASVNAYLPTQYTRESVLNISGAERKFCVSMYCKKYSRKSLHLHKWFGGHVPE